VAKPEHVAKPEPVAKPVEAAPSQPTPAVAAADAPSVQACRDALKKRDLKLVSAKCETALTADSSLAKPLLAFAKGQFEKGKSAQAAVWARKIVQVNSSLADAYLIMGAAEQEARHAAAAKTAYQRYLELAPKGPYAEDVKSSLKSL
jgi:Tfp pilus assembly protein PilF